MMAAQPGWPALVNTRHKETSVSKPIANPSPDMKKLKTPHSKSLIFWTPPAVHRDYLDERAMDTLFRICALARALFVCTPKWARGSEGRLSQIGCRRCRRPIL